MTQGKFIVLQKPNYITRDIFYKIIFKDGLFYFCRIKSSEVRKQSGDLINLTEKSTEKELLKNRRSFKLAAFEISSININGERSYWNALNSGTVEFVVNGKIKKYIISYLTTSDELKIFLEKTGCQNVTETITQKPEEEKLPRLKRGEAKRIKRNLSIITKFSGIFIAAIFLWIFYPVYLNVGIVVLLILPFLSLFLLWHYRAYFKKSNRKGSAWSYCISFVILSPLFLCLVYIANFEIIYPAAFLIAIPIVAVLTTVICLIKNKKFRGKATAWGIAFFAAALFFSTALTTNYFINVKNVADYAVTVQNKIYHRGGYRQAPRFYAVVGPVGEEESMEMSVSSIVYNKLWIGEKTKLSIKKGLWGIEWYEIE